MKVNLPIDVILPNDYKTNEDPKVLEKWLAELVRALEDLFKKAYYDIAFGRSKFSVFTSLPTTSDLQEGQLALYGSNLYTSINSTIYKLGLTEVNVGNLICRVTVTS